MGGDFAPQAILKGAIEAKKALNSEVDIVLIGNESIARELLIQLNFDPEKFIYINASQVVEMSEHATRALKKKPDNSISVGFKALKLGEIDVLASAGNSGAMLVGSMFSVGPVPGVIRPCITSVLPKENGGVGVILDVGVNADCKPDVLYQFAILGSLFAELVYQIKSPKVGLLNIGEEKEKGNLLTQATHTLLDGAEEVNFIGNVEGRDLFNDKADVIICDGFTGNVVLKQAESFYELIAKRGYLDDYFSRFNYENYGGTPVLGVNGNVLIGHGISSPKAIKNMILLGRDLVEAKLTDKIKKAFK